MSPEATADKAHDALDAIDDALDRILAATDHLDPTKCPRHSPTTPQEADDDDDPAH